MLTPLLTYVVDEAIKLVGAERGYIVLFESDGTLDFRVMRDQAGNGLEDAHDQISTTVLRQVATSGEPLVVRNALNDPRFADAESVIILQLRSIVCVPLISRGETIGAIYVENRTIRNRFSDSDAMPLVIFANQAAIAIENAALNDELEKRVQTRTRALEVTKTQLERSWAATVEANRLRTVWLSQIAHDLRAPLGIAAGALELLYDGALGELNDEQLDWIAKSKQAVHHVATLAEDVLVLMRLEEGKIDLKPERINLEQFLQKIYEMGAGLPWAVEVEYKLKISSPLPEVVVDPIRLEQILLNLLSNAQKFTDEGEVVLQARHYPDLEEIRINVRDSGVGIPIAEMDKLFERFERIERNEPRQQSGIGLGLAICRELVEMHGGRVWVESELDEGSNFIFSLPAPSLPPQERLSVSSNKTQD